MPSITERRDVMKSLTKKQIDNVVDASFDNAFADLSTSLKSELYPSAFVNEYSWIRVQNALKINNNHLKDAIKQCLQELLLD